MDIFRDLKERHLTRIILTYLAAGWVVVALVSQLVDHEIVPDPTYRVVLALYICGIPATLVLGWFHGKRGRQKFVPLEIGMLSLVGVSAIGLTVHLLRGPEEAGAAGDALDLRSVAVLYFEDRTGRDSLAYLPEALTEGLIERLEDVRGLDVVSRNGSARFRDGVLPLDSVARVLGVGTLIHGRLELEGERVRATVRLVDGNQGADIDRSTLDWPAEALLTAPEELAREVSLRLRERLGEEVRLRESRRGTSSLAAWTLLQRAESERRRAEEAVEGEDLAGAVAALDAAAGLLEQAGAQDPEWAEPPVLAARVLYLRSWLVHHLPEAAGFLTAAEEAATRGLERAPGHAGALEVRGTARYRMWLLQLRADPGEAAALVSAARRDLEEAVRSDPGLASAHNTLSHLYARLDDLPASVLAARRAYEEDAWLSAADQILWRLYSTSYDLEQYPQARRWCEEGGRRFPENFRFQECRLWLMTMAGAEADVDEAWRIRERMVPLVPETSRPYFAELGRLLVAAAAARVGMADSARAVLEASTAAGVDQSQELLGYEALVLTLLGDRDGAVERLGRYAAANPGHFDRNAALHWWWRDLQDHPGFRGLQELQAGSGHDR